MSINIVIQSKTMDVLQSEAAFFGVNATALAKAILDAVVMGGDTRRVLQGVDVESYQPAKRGRRPSAMGIFKGKMCFVSDAAAQTGMPLNLVKNRIRDGWTLERAVTTPVGKRGRPAKNGAK